MSAHDQVRAARSTDIPALAAMLGELGYPVEPLALRPRLERLLARSDHHVLVAHGTDDSDVLGLLSLHFFPVILRDAEAGLITALVVTGRARGAGVGRLLVTRAESMARQQGAERVMVTTHLQRAGAHAFYERLGYELTGRRYVKVLD